MDATEQNNTGFKARCLLRQAKWGMLATVGAFDVSRGGAATEAARVGISGDTGFSHGDGLPFASLVTHTVAPDGAVLMLLSSMAVHTQHLVAHPACALMVTGQPENLNWQTAPRVTVTGVAAPMPDPDLRAYWLAQHSFARHYAQFADFSLWRLAVSGGLYIGGFGQATLLGTAQLSGAPEAVATLREAASRIVAHCNREHAEALNRMAHMSGGKGHWRMLDVDTDGFDLVQDQTVLRIAFPAPVADEAGVRAALQSLAEVARRHF